MYFMYLSNRPTFIKYLGLCKFDGILKIRTGESQILLLDMIMNPHHVEWVARRKIISYNRHELSIRGPFKVF